MHARTIQLTTSDDAAQLRRQVMFHLAIDAVAPTTAYVCARCGTILGFSGPFDLVRPQDVDCPSCGTFNTLEAA